MRRAVLDHVSYSLNSLKGGYVGDYIGKYWTLNPRLIKGNTRSLGYSSCVAVAWSNCKPGKMLPIGLYSDYIGTMEKNMETTMS